MIDLKPRVNGAHSLPRTKVALVYKKTDELRACQLLLAHRKLESTVRRFGVERGDGLALSEQGDLGHTRKRTFLVAVMGRGQPFRTRRSALR